MSAAIEGEPRAARLHREAIVIDGQGVRLEDPPSLAGGATAVVVTLAWKPIHDTTWALRRVSEQLDFIDYYADRLSLIRTTADIERAKSEGKQGVIVNFEHSAPVGSDLSLVRTFYELGVRSMQLTYNDRTPFGDGCLEPTDLGLTSFGRQLIRSMERCGMLVDLSHVGRRTGMDALAYARRPMVFGHRNPAAMFDSPQNITDDEIRACAATGGVIGITATSSFYGPANAPRPTVADMVSHVSYVADLVGIEHVGVAYEAPAETSAFRMSARPDRDRDPVATRSASERRLAGAESRADLPKLTAELVRRGFSDEDVRAVLGANWMRVFAEAWTPRPPRASVATF